MVLAGCLLPGCKKTTDTVTTTTDNSTTIYNLGTDELIVNNEIDQAVSEAVAAISLSSTTSGRVMNVLQTLVPGATVDTSQISSGIVSIYYYSKDHDTTKLRGGSVSIKLPKVASVIVPWKNAGTTATITITNFEVRFLKNNTSVWMSGNLTLTNVYGGLQKNLIPGDSLVQKLRGQIQYTDNDNNVVITTYGWNLHNTRVIGMLANNDITITTRADTNVGGYNNVVTWGQNRYNNNFYTSLTTPIYRDITSTNFYNPLSGIKQVNCSVNPYTLTMDVDANGNPAVGNPYGYRMDWTLNSTAQKLVEKYY